MGDPAVRICICIHGPTPEVHRDVEVQVEIQTCVLQTRISRGDSCGSGTSTTVRGGSGFGSGGDSSCERPCVPTVALSHQKILLDRLLLPLLYFDFGPSI
jgi:hypothetical protein